MTATKEKTDKKEDEISEFFNSVKDTISVSNKIMDVLEKKFTQEQIISFVLVSTYNLYAKDNEEFMKMQKTFLDTFDAMSKAGVIKFRKSEYV